MSRFLQNKLGSFSSLSSLNIITAGNVTLSYTRVQNAYRVSTMALSPHIQILITAHLPHLSISVFIDTFSSLLLTLNQPGWLERGSIWWCPVCLCYSLLPGTWGKSLGWAMFRARWQEVTHGVSLHNSPLAIQKDPQKPCAQTFLAGPTLRGKKRGLLHRTLGDEVHVLEFPGCFLPPPPPTMLQTLEGLILWLPQMPESRHAH